MNQYNILINGREYLATTETETDYLGRVFQRLILLEGVRREDGGFLHWQVWPQN